MRNGMTRLVAILATVLTVSALATAPVAADPPHQNINVAGVGVPGGFGDNGCDDAGYESVDYTIALSGDLTGCIYGVILSESFNEKNGRYTSNDHETFVGSLGALSGTWEMDETFSAVFDLETGAQLSGGCKHPIIDGSGTGDFEGVDGRLKFIDDVDAGTADYTGRIQVDL